MRQQIAGPHRAEQGSAHDVDRVAPVSQLLSDQRRGQAFGPGHQMSRRRTMAPKRFHLSIASQRPRGSVIATRPGPPKRTSCEAISSPVADFRIVTVESLQMGNHRIRPTDPSDTCTRVWLWKLGRPDAMLIKEDVNCGVPTSMGASRNSRLSALRGLGIQLLAWHCGRDDALRIAISADAPSGMILLILCEVPPTSLLARFSATNVPRFPDGYQGRRASRQNNALWGGRVSR